MIRWFGNVVCARWPSKLRNCAEVKRAGVMVEIWRGLAACQAATSWRIEDALATGRFHAVLGDRESVVEAWLMFS